MDDHSRVAFSKVYPDETAASATAFLTAALAYCQHLGIRVRRVLTDNGGCYRSRAFNARCAQAGLRHRYTRPFTPRTNGKAERFIQTALREWAYAHVYNTSDQRTAHLAPWRVSPSRRTACVLDALEQAIYARRGAALTGRVHHRDAGSQYLSMRYTDRLVDAGIAPSGGSQGDASDNALAESVIGLYKTEVIRRKGPWRTLEAVAFATVTWVDWFNTRRLLGPLGDIPPAEFEAQYYEQAEVA